MSKSTGTIGSISNLASLPGDWSSHRMVLVSAWMCDMMGGLTLKQGIECWPIGNVLAFRRTLSWTSQKDGTPISEAEICQGFCKVMVGFCRSSIFQIGHLMLKHGWHRFRVQTTSGLLQYCVYWPNQQLKRYWPCFWQFHGNLDTSSSVWRSLKTPWSCDTNLTPENHRPCPDCPDPSLPCPTLLQSSHYPLQCSK